MAADAQEFAERSPHQQRKGNSQRSVDKSATARFQDFVQIHAETEGHDGTLEESSRDAATVVDVRMRETEAEENSNGESDRRRKQSRERKDDGKKKNDFRECGHRLQKEYQAAHRLSQQEPQSASAKRSSALGAFCVPDSRQRSSFFAKLVARVVAEIPAGAIFLCRCLLRGERRVRISPARALTVRGAGARGRRRF